ncbi:MAG: NAD(P)H-binding protein, partial [bacterium]
MDKPVLVTGATGYVGGRLVPKLLEADYRVRAVSRTLEKLEGRPWADHEMVELVEANALDRESVQQACRGCDAAYYLIHSMNPGSMDFEEADRRAARNMARAAEAEGVNRLIYLGGLGEPDAELSKHLRSRAEVARILSESEVPTTVLRAAIIIGSGSVSFEILRYLVERLPVMTTPRWVQTESQPIAIRNVLNYLVGCLEHPETAGETYDIGGPDTVTYAELMQTYADVVDLPRRWIIPLPVLTPKLSSFWVHLVTPVPASIARPLIGGLRTPALCRDNRIREIIPQELIGVKKAMQLAVNVVESEDVPSSWSDAGKIPPAEWADESDPEWAGGDLFEDHRTVWVDGDPDSLWSVIDRIGGENGWYY